MILATREKESRCFFFDMENAAFYDGRRRVAVEADWEMTVEDMHCRMDFALLESSHTFVQWIFPTDAPSRFNARCAVLRPEEARHVATRLVSSLRLLESFHMMLAFYGFALDRPARVVRVVAPARLDHLVRHTHNWMRVTRILRSLVLFGCAPYALAFCDALVREVAAGALAPCAGSCAEHWQPACRAPAPSGFPTRTCLDAFDALPPTARVAMCCKLLRAVRCAGAVRVVREIAPTGCVVIDVPTPKKLCILTPHRTELVVLERDRRRVVALDAVACLLVDDAPTRIDRTDCCRGLRAYRAVRASAAYGGSSPLVGALPLARA